MTEHYSLFIWNHGFLQQLQNPYFNEIKSQSVNETGDESERREKVLKGNYAILGTVIGNVFFPYHRVFSADLKVRKFSIWFVLTSGLYDELIVIRSKLVSNLRTDLRSDFKTNSRSNLRLDLKPCETL